MSLYSTARLTTLRHGPCFFTESIRAGLLRLPGSPGWLTATAACLAPFHRRPPLAAKSVPHERNPSRNAKLGRAQSRSSRRRATTSPLEVEPELPRSVTARELEERDVRVAIRHVLTQHHNQTMLERRKVKCEAEEKQEDEKAALEALEKALARQEALLSRRDGDDRASDKGSSPSSLVGVYASALGKSAHQTAAPLPALSLPELQRLHHHIRMRRRQAEKERHAEQLCGPDGTAGVQGVLPVAVHTEASFTPVRGLGASKWLQPNRVGAAAEEGAVLDSAASSTSFSLDPDLSVYSYDGDVRISSASVVLAQRQELERRVRHGTSPYSEGQVAADSSDPNLQNVTPENYKRPQTQEEEPDEFHVVTSPTTFGKYEENDDL